jgi:hypothetical protein
MGDGVLDLRVIDVGVLPNAYGPILAQLCYTNYRAAHDIDLQLWSFTPSSSEVSINTLRLNLVVQEFADVPG